MYTPIEIEDYLQRKHIKDLPQEVKDKIREVRTTWNYVPLEMFRELHTTLRMVKRTKTLKKMRSLFTNSQDIVYFNSYTQTFDSVGYFYSEQFLEESDKKEAEAKQMVLDIRAQKKAEKQKK